MFDLYCAHCGEPWDHDMLHETPRGLGYMDAAKSFKVQGCGLFNTILRERLEGRPVVCKAAPVVSVAELSGINAAHELSDYPDEWDYDLARACFL